MKRHTPAVQRMVDDAAALVRGVAPDAFPTGFVLLTDPLPGLIFGVSVGPGVKLAQAHGDRHGRGSVWVDPDKFTGGAPTPTPEAAAKYNAIVLHEVAHAVTTPDVADSATATAALEHIAHKKEYTAEVVARSHCHRWVAAYVCQLKRAMAWRPRVADEMCAAIVRDVHRYGFDVLAVVRAVSGFSMDGSLRDLLAAGGEWDQRLAERLPGLEARLPVIIEAGTSRPAGVRGCA